jgi:hypothetical protein
MRPTTLLIISAILIESLVACPWDTTPERSDESGPTVSSSPQGPAAGVSAAGPVAGAAAAASVRDAVASATAARFPPAPDLNTLCMLVVDQTTYEDAKKLLPGVPQNESMDAASATLSYRFSREASATPNRNSGGSQGGDDSGVSLYLSFKWNDGSVWKGHVLTDKKPILGYILSELSINGLPYPSCWPHVET